MNLVEVKDVSVSVAKQSILKNINLDIKRNEIVGLIGPSGSGKTTLIKTIIGMQKYQGKIKIMNEEKFNLNLYKTIGYMAQSDAFYENLNGQENLEFFASLYGMNKREIQSRINYIQEIIQLNSNLKKKTKYYSGGMQRRLSFAISLIHNPELLILDEPTVGLDPKLKINIWKELEKLKKENKTILITTHIMEEALKCDRLVLINDGRIIAHGSVDELLCQYNVNNIEDIFIKMEDLV